MTSPPKDVLDHFVKVASALQNAREGNRLAHFKPYPKQKWFISCKSKIKVLGGGNRVGKSHLVSFEVACHATGRYPDWWDGVRFDGPVDIWIVGETAVRVRDTIQEKLFGRIGKIGTGFIPRECFNEENIIKKTGIPYAIDKAMIKHVSGGMSLIQFFSYEMEREKFGGSSVHWIVFDEEPPEDIYNECKMRVLEYKGYISFAFTPLKGVTPLYQTLAEDDTVAKFTLTIEDVQHLDISELERLTAGMSDAERKARIYGVATTGSGKIFQFEEDDYICEDFQVSRWWPKIGGLDVGISHPTAAVALAMDPHSKTYYVFNEYQIAAKTAKEHSWHLRNWGMKFAMDPSAWNRQIGTAQSTAKIYQEEGLNVFKANNDREASIHKIRQLIREGRLYIFEGCVELLKQMRLYRANDKGEVIKEKDDLIDALRYAIMAIEKYGDVAQNDIDSMKVQSYEYRPATCYGRVYG